MAFDPYGRPAVPLHVAQQLQEERDLLYGRLQQAMEQIAIARQGLQRHADQELRLRDAVAALEDDRQALIGRAQQLEHALGRALGELERERASREQSAEPERVTAELAEARKVQTELQAELLDARTALDELRQQLDDTLARCNAEPPPQPEPAADEELLARYKHAAEHYAADLANLRRRLDEEKTAARSRERVARLRGLAGIHDALARSLRQIEDQESAWYKGNEALLREVRAELSRAGAEALGAEGEPFDPKLHEAVTTVPAGERPPGTLVHVEQVGFRLAGGELVRPARVVVAAQEE